MITLINRFSKYSIVIFGFLAITLSYAQDERAEDISILDVDANGEVDALTDGLLLLRSMFELTDDALVTGVVDSANCKECNAEGIDSYITSIKGTTYGGLTPDAGPAGPQGEKGDKGDTGAVGAKGDAGTDGTNGAKGDTGATGVAGAKGDTGSQGVAGVKGDAGADGTDGAKGDTGATGATGATGTAGSTGAKGDTGATGAKGDTGSQGVAGTDGTDGAKGDTGATGATGPQGATGTKGDTGAAGVAGAAIALGLSSSTALAGDTTTITSGQASAITTNTDKVEAITNPHRDYSIISSENLDSGLVRTKLYFYELQDFSTTARRDEDNSGLYIYNGHESVVNALGTFRGHYSFRADYGTTYSDPRGPNSPPISCPDGTALQRQPYDVVYDASFRNESGGFVFSNRGTVNAGIYSGCDVAEYYYLEGKGSGVYSCVSRAAYYGAFGGGGGEGWSKAYAPDSGEDLPYIVVGTFDRESNAGWGTYYLEIDAPADCLNL